MKRAALVPIAGNPFILKAWLSCYDKIWKNEVDKTYIFINAPYIDTSVLDYEVELVKQYTSNENIVLLVMNKEIGHAEALAKLVDECKEEFVLFLEEDFYLIESGYISKFFEMVENRQVDGVVSGRGCWSDAAAQKICNTFGLQREHIAFEPCFCFLPMSLLLKTDRNFGWKTFIHGEPVKELNNWVPSTKEEGDIFAWFSLQLISAGLKFHYIPQNRLTLYYNQKVEPPAPWIHFGNTHGTMGCHLVGRVLFEPCLQEHLSIFEYQVALWSSFCELFPIPSSSLASSFNTYYMSKVEESISKTGLRRDQIEGYKNLFFNSIFKFFSEKV